MAAYLVIGEPKLAVELFRAQLAGARDTHVFARTGLVIALVTAGFDGEAMAAATRLIDAAEATHNPWRLSYALLAVGLAFRDLDPDRAREALRRGLIVAQDSGNRMLESLLATALSPLEAEHRDPLAALDHITLATRNCYDSGNVGLISTPWQRSRYSSTTVRTIPAKSSAFRRLGRSPPRRGISRGMIVLRQE